MESNVCDYNHLDEGVLIPPRKRLLAGFKKQNSNDQSHASTSASPPATPTEVDTRVKKLLSYHSSGGGSSFSIEEIAEASMKAALAAAKVAEASRAAAEEKAAIAAKAIATAKSALDLVAAFSEESSGRDRHVKKNKSKKQVTVHSLYKKRDEVPNDESEEEIAQKLHQAVYRSPRLSKHPSPSSDSKSLDHKRLKISPVGEKTRLPIGGMIERVSCGLINGDVALDAEGSSHEVADLEKEKSSQCLTKLISSNWRMDKKDIVTHKRKARKQLIQMVEGRVKLS